MARQFTYRRRVEFRDTDMAGIVHFSVFFTYMEEAEHEFLRSVGLAVFSELDGEQVSWPRVAAECNYRTAIKFEDEIEVRISIIRIGKTSVTYRHDIYRDEFLVADGAVTAVCCKFVHGEKPASIAIPNSFLEKFNPFLAESSD